MRIELLLLLSCLVVSSCRAQDVQRAGVLFYNVENLMDTIDNPMKLDDEFTPSSEKQWNTERYQIKLGRIAQVISSTSNQLPVLVGLCEVENREVLEDLAKQPDLLPAAYQVVQFDSPDERGIDCALLYQPALFKVTNAYPVPVRLPQEDGGSTRDILYVQGILTGAKKTQVLHVFTNHWPSRYEGEELTRGRRVMAAKVLKSQVDSLQELYKDPSIIIMGDFNDTPFDESLLVALGAHTQDNTFPEESLVNLVASFQLKNEGSYNYKGNWQALDQMIVNDALLLPASNLRVDVKQVRFIKNDFQMFQSDKYGPTPNRTYGGNKFYGGYSDHLPVYLELLYR